MIRQEVVEFARRRFLLGGLDIKGMHGEGHWSRVATYGLLLAAAMEGRTDEIIDLDVIVHFAYLHDMERNTEQSCPWHGAAAAIMVDTNRTNFQLTETQLNTLVEAIEGHSDGRKSSCPTIGICWDADRLDLQRYGLLPIPELMSTASGWAIAQQLREKEHG